MSKRYERATAHNRVQAVFTRFKKDNFGDSMGIPLYDLYGPEYLRRQ